RLPCPFSFLPCHSSRLPRPFSFLPCHSSRLPCPISHLRPGRPTSDIGGQESHPAEPVPQRILPRIRGKAAAEPLGALASRRPTYSAFSAPRQARAERL